MIKVSGVTKKYPARTAVDNISFEVGRGEIVGFLGPNGAGKTTTMRLLTGYLTPASGSIEVAGYNIETDPLEVRRRIGYLPENCPLYPEMRVDEYLHFRAGLKGVRPSARRARVKEVKALCGLSDVGRRIIGQLSKGYRQRVGLADTLVHDPELLILDEPTVGLDPHQIRQVRELIRRLAQQHTILLSTHILSEVEAICERIMIIDEGVIVASDTEENLHRRLHALVSIEMEVCGDLDSIIENVNEQQGVSVIRSEALGDEWIRLEIEADSGSRRVDLFNLAVSKGWMLRELTEQEHSLEDTFVQITRGKGGRS